VGARVIMINRKEEQGQDAISTIKKEVGDDAKIEWLPCDLGSLKEVKKVFTDLREREERLDLVSHANLQASFMVRC
jgi:NAD(P)-dependent dehydrogenase (short-subunit alcohol dehydrogenase family)